MKICLQKLVILSLFIVSPAYASSGSWFGSSQDSDSSPSPYPSSFSSWTPSQYSSFQETFASLRDSTFDAWDESRLREWLLVQGIVAPKGTKEELVLIAKRRWRDWQEANEHYSSAASETASAYASDASAAAFGAASTVSSYAAQATADVLSKRPFDSTKDYVWSTWDDTAVRKFLVDKGVIDTRTAAGKKRDELAQLAQTHYESASGNVWEIWSDSYIRDWLAAHHLIDTRNSVQKTRDEYNKHMQSYYYDTKQHVWDSWSDSDMRTWLIDNGFMKSDAVATRDEMKKAIQKNFYSAQSTLTSAWSESQMRTWLIENGYLRSDSQVRKDEIVSLFRAKYYSAASIISSSTAPYLTWPDARLRAFLRESGVSESMLPTSRPSLLQEVRIRWVRTSTSAERMLARLKEVLDDNVVGPVEDRLVRAWEVLKGAGGDSQEYAEEKYGDSQRVFEDMKGRAYEKVNGEL
ncbi:hypothetical protein GGU11DRAFT_721244 [Lentinula aff. detonsa]|uniref:Uncharacterized protein n=1 Tax=Lentinula aff. detonsa TaxID=2804958 RepID=A0AA38KL85_9AGAR|nr:hypothetical protein GGU10DRAFT_300987 [Lentinula aff. detonsa]KAJ3799622.1 hypothetical protein GGU11DRAFT_721244 [Lentinula aff. detonsa]